METLCLFVEIPICAFRPNWSREYQDTYPYPPLVIVYGMLLSLSGVDWQQKENYAGVELALALQGKPDKYRVFRKFRRVPQSKSKGKPEPDPLTSRRPDYQDLLIDLKLWVWLRDGQAEVSLVDKVETALDKSRREEIKRYGGLSLGESSHLVNAISIKEPIGEGQFLSKTQEGYYSFPVWVHHPRCGEGKTKLERFSILSSQPLKQPKPNDPRWISIGP